MESARNLVANLSLKAKVALTLTAAFLSIVLPLAAFLLPFLQEQRQSLLAKDERLLSTLREGYERGFIYDLLSENKSALEVRLADLAAQEGILCVRLEAAGSDLEATSDAGSISALTGENPGASDSGPPRVLMIHTDGQGDLLGGGGRRLGTTRVGMGLLPRWREAANEPFFEEASWRGRGAIEYTTTLSAGAEVFGHLHILYSLADVQRSQALTRTLFFGLVAATFLLLLVLLRALISRMVIAPLVEVQGAMSRAARGDLSAQLPVRSKDELGAMAEAFNGMVLELASSKHAIDDYSRNLEHMVTARTRALKASEADLLDVKTRLQTILASVATGVISVDEAGHVTTFNERAAEILGIPRDVCGQSLDGVLQGELKRIVEVVRSVDAVESPRREAQISCQLSQGRRTLSVVASALPGDGQGSGTVVVLEDLTQILATQRLGAWKEAVERVIHEIKNPLTPVGLAAETMKSAYTKDPARFREIFPSAIDMVLSSVSDLKALIAQFGRFSRLPEVRLQSSDLNELVRTSLGAYEQGEKKVTLALGEGLPAVLADPDQLKRVFLNVVNNALEAVEGREGEILVTTTRVEGGAMVSVADRGPGIEDVERVFEPYYTTKVKGTGLGLSIARQIIEEHRGRIVVESRVGIGTTVSIFLRGVPS